MGRSDPEWARREVAGPIRPGQDDRHDIRKREIDLLQHEEPCAEVDWIPVASIASRGWSRRGRREPDRVDHRASELVDRDVGIRNDLITVCRDGSLAIDVPAGPLWAVVPEIET